MKNYKILCEEFYELLQQVLFLPQTQGAINKELGDSCVHLFRKYKRVMEQKDMDITEKFFTVFKRVNRIRDQIIALPENEKQLHMEEYKNHAREFESVILVLISELIDFDNIKKVVAKEVESLVQSKLAGIISRKYDMVISDKLKNIDNDIQNKLSERLIDILDSEIFIKKFQEYKPDLYKLIKNRPNEFQSGHDDTVEVKPKVRKKRK